jgi:hypothetical protein
MRVFCDFWNRYFLDLFLVFLDFNFQLDILVTRIQQGCVKYQPGWPKCPGTAGKTGTPSKFIKSLKSPFIFSPFKALLTIADPDPAVTY